MNHYSDMSQFIYQNFSVFKNKLVFIYESEIQQKKHKFTHTIETNNFNIQTNDAVAQHFAFYIGLSIIPYYYSLQFHKRIIVKAAIISSNSLNFFQNYFENGLAEFMYQNKIPFDLFPKLECESSVKLPDIANLSRKPRNNKYLLSHGGGKDSILSGELLSKANIPFSWFVMSYDGLRLDTIKKSIDISPQKDTFIVNQKPHPYNYAQKFVSLNGGYLGHKPMNAYLAFLGSFVAYLQNLKGFIVSNEASASVGNLKINDRDINHQYSKSFEFENNFRSFLEHNLSVGIDYFSLLRPLSEIEIAKRFLKYPKYLKAFMSCNAGIETGSWCKKCPKCLFVYLMIYAYGGKKKAMSTFDNNELLSKDDLFKLFCELAGISGHKPFECVGEIDETRVLLTKITHHDQSRFMNLFRKKFGDNKHQQELRDLEEKYSTLSNNHNIPTELFSNVF